jgi:hypothetical protein
LAKNTSGKHKKRSTDFLPPYASQSQLAVMISFRAFTACALGNEEWRPLMGMLCFGNQATIWVKSQCGWGRSRRQIISRRDSLAQSCRVGSIEHMQQRYRSDLIARHVQRASALSFGSGLRRKGLEHVASHEEGHMLLSRRQVLKRPLGAIEALKGAQEAFGGIGGGGTPGRADCWQQLG